MKKFIIEHEGECLAVLIILLAVAAALTSFKPLPGVIMYALIFAAGTYVWQIGEREYFDVHERMAEADACRRQPAGWTCSRGEGHEGPCATHRAGAGPDGKPMFQGALYDLGTPEQLRADLQRSDRDWLAAKQEKPLEFNTIPDQVSLEPARQRIREAHARWAEKRAADLMARDLKGGAS